MAKIDDAAATKALESVKGAATKKQAEAFEKSGVDGQKLSAMTVQQIADLAETFDYSPGGLLNKLLGVGQRAAKTA